MIEGQCEVVARTGPGIYCPLAALPGSWSAPPALRPRRSASASAGRVDDADAAMHLRDLVGSLTVGAWQLGGLVGVTTLGMRDRVGLLAELFGAVRFGGSSTRRRA